MLLPTNDIKEEIKEPIKPKIKPVKEEIKPLNNHLEFLTIQDNYFLGFIVVEEKKYPFSIKKEDRTGVLIDNYLKIINKIINRDIKDLTFVEHDVYIVTFKNDSTKMENNNSRLLTEIKKLADTIEISKKYLIEELII